MSTRTLLRIALVATLAVVTAAGSAQHVSARVALHDFAGRWVQASDDGTQLEIVEIEAVGDGVHGVITSVERGYFSGRTTVKGQLRLAGALRGGALDLQVGDGSGASAAATGLRRGEYLVLRHGDQETGYARPGRPLLESAEGSAEAMALARAIQGRIFAAGSQAGGRGAFVGARVRVAFCGDGSMAYDASDLAATPGALPGGGVDMGRAVARRGTWSIVLRAGTPVVHASWQGTGSSYSLSAYFDVKPAADGRSALVDGTRLPLAGQC